MPSVLEVCNGGGEYILFERERKRGEEGGDRDEGERGMMSGLLNLLSRVGPTVTKNNQINQILSKITLNTEIQEVDTIFMKNF